MGCTTIISYGELSSLGYETYETHFYRRWGLKES